LVQFVSVLALSELPFDRDTQPLILSLLPFDLAGLFFVIGSRLLWPAKRLTCKPNAVILQPLSIIVLVQRELDKGLFVISSLLSGEKI